MIPEPPGYNYPSEGYLPDIRLRDIQAAKKIIHINKNIIQQNAKRGTAEPVCRVQQGSKTRYAMEVVIKGPSKLIYSPDKPLACGAKLWIETYSEIELVGESAVSKSQPKKVAKKK